MSNWISVHYPIAPDDELPPERKVVLVWLGDEKESNALPYCAYVRYHSDGPFFVVYHGGSSSGDRGVDVVAWCDCLPDTGPDLPQARMYSAEQREGRGHPARTKGTP